MLRLRETLAARLPLDFRVLYRQFLLRVVGARWAAGLVFNVFAAALEGFQRFDLSNRAQMLAPLVRGPLSVILVMYGYGLRQMGIALLLGQTCCYIATYIYCRRVFPELRLSPRNIHLGGLVRFFPTPARPSAG